MKKALLIFASLLLAALLQQLLGMGLLWLSELGPHESESLISALGTLGFWLMPLSPFLLGIYWLPLTTWLAYWAISGRRKP